MSRAFAKEDSAGGELRFTARPELPAGVPNYVTARGLALLEAERQEFLAQIAAFERETDAETKIAEVRLSLDELELRLNDAQLVELGPVTSDTQAQIGHVLTVEFGPNDVDTLTITGVDEADLDNAVSFLSPLAVALLGKRAGEVGTYQVGSETRQVKLRAIALPDEAGTA